MDSKLARIARVAHVKSKARTRRRGAVLVEYSLVLTLVAVPTVAGIIAGGMAMLSQYRAGRDAMLQSNP